MRRLRTARWRTATRCLAVVVVAAGAVLVTPVAARAEPDLAPVMLVLDASGSMTEALAGGRRPDGRREGGGAHAGAAGAG